MKVITEDRLIALQKQLIKRESELSGQDELFFGGKRVQVESLIEECHEIDFLFEESDELTVTRLRSMDDAPMDGTPILVCYSTECPLEKVYWDDQRSKFRLDDNYFYEKANLIGWIPIPVYKPEQC